MITKKAPKNNPKATKTIPTCGAIITALFLLSGCDMKMSKHETEQYNLNQNADACYKYSNNDKKYSSCLEKLGFSSTPLIETYNPYADFKGAK